MKKINDKSVLFSIVKEYQNYNTVIIFGNKIKLKQKRIITLYTVKTILLSELILFKRENILV